MNGIGGLSMDAGFFTLTPSDGTSQSAWTMDIFEHFADPARFDVIATAQNTLDRFMRGDLLPYVHFSHHQFVVTMRKIRERFENAGRGSLDPDGSERFTLSCHLLTFTSSVRTLYEQSTKRISALGSKGGIDALRQLFSSAYDEHFEYRFSYKLRDFLAHRNLGSLTINYRKSEDTRPSGIIVPTSEVHAYLNRDELLKERDVWSAKVLPEIEALPELIDIEPIVDKTMDIVRHIAGGARLLLFPDIREHLAALTAARDSFSDREGTPGMFRIDGGIADLGTSRHHKMPQLVLDFRLIEEVEAVLAAATEPVVAGEAGGPDASP